jgi:hypothetical protein
MDKDLYLYAIIILWPATFKIVAKSDPIHIPNLYACDKERLVVECSICLKSISMNDIEMTKCNHTFHSTLLVWKKQIIFVLFVNLSTRKESSL